MIGLELLLLGQYILSDLVTVYDCLLLLFSYAASISSEPTGLRRGCPSLGSAGLALGGAAWRGALLDEEPGPGSRRRP